MDITSKSNEKIKYIKSLNEKKFRQKYNAFYLEGVKVISELLDIYEDMAVNIEFIAYSLDILKNTNGHDKLLEKINKIKNLKLIEISKELFEDITDTVNSQGILAVRKRNNKEEIKFNSNILILDKVQDAGNLGTIIRTANAFGIYNIVCSKGTTDAYAPKVVRSTMLGIVKSNIVYTEDIKDFIFNLKKEGYKIISTALYDSTYMNENTFKAKCAIVIGNEANGVSEEVLKISDEKIKIKIENSTESLNAACAASIVLYNQYISKK